MKFLLILLFAFNLNAMEPDSDDEGSTESTVQSTIEEGVELTAFTRKTSDLPQTININILGIDSSTSDGKKKLEEMMDQVQSYILEHFLIEDNGQTAKNKESEPQS